MCLPTFLALFLVIKEPKPRIYTFSFFDRDALISEKNVSMVTRTSTLGTPVFSAMMLTKSAFLITLIYSKLCLFFGNSGGQSSKILWIMNHRVTHFYFAHAFITPWRTREKGQKGAREQRIKGRI